VFLANPAEVAGRAMTLEPRLESYVRRAVASSPAWELSLAELRAEPDAELPEIWGDVDQVDHVEDLAIEGPGGSLRVRVYRPVSDEPLPGLVWFHGGGWVVGSIGSHDPVCRHLARTTPCCVISVDYRLAPEHPFPAAVEDCWAALEWVSRETERLGVDRARLAIGGDSAGGNLAAVIALRARAARLPLALQVLVYPVTDSDLDSPSYLEHAEGLNLTRERMEWYWRTYLAGADGAQPDASPLHSADLSGVTTALVQTAEYDPLRSEGEAYATRLAEDGVPVTLTRYEGMIHGFIRMPALTDVALVSLAETAAAVRTLGAPAPG
jgi:acetyl esterase